MFCSRRRLLLFLVFVIFCQLWLHWHSYRYIITTGGSPREGASDLSVPSEMSSIADPPNVLQRTEKAEVVFVPAPPQAAWYIVLMEMPGLYDTTTSDPTKIWLQHQLTDGHIVLATRARALPYEVDHRVCVAYLRGDITLAHALAQILQRLPSRRVLVSVSGLVPSSNFFVSEMVRENLEKDTEGRDTIATCTVTDDEGRFVAVHGLGVASGTPTDPLVIYPRLAGVSARDDRIRTPHSVFLPSLLCLAGPPAILGECIRQEALSGTYLDVTDLEDEFVVYGGLLHCQTEKKLEFLAVPPQIQLPQHVSAEVIRRTLMDSVARAESPLSDTARAMLRKYRVPLSTELSRQKVEQRLSDTQLIWDSFCGCTGVNVEEIAYLEALQHFVDVRAVASENCWCQGYPTHVQQSLARMSQEKPTSPSFTVWVSHKPADFYPIFPYHGTINYLPRPDVVVGRSMIEVDRLPVSWVSRINEGRHVDEVWVPCTFMRDVFVSSGVHSKLIHVIPEAIDVHMYNPESVQALEDGAVEGQFIRAPVGAYRFLSNFKWEERKGWDVLLRAYFTTFTAEDNVVLYLKTFLYLDSDPYNAHKVMNKVLDFARSLRSEGIDTDRLPRVVPLTALTDAVDMPRLYKSVDCFVLPTRGEGWGLPMQEAMAMGLPTIATNWSGPSEFMTNETSLLLNIEGKELARGPFAGHNARWAVPSLRHLRHLMRWVVTHPEEARRVGSRARKHIVAKFSQEAVIPKILDRIRELRALKRP